MGTTPFKGSRTWEEQEEQEEEKEKMTKRMHTGKSVVSISKTQSTHTHTQTSTQEQVHTPKQTCTHMRARTHACHPPCICLYIAPRTQQRTQKFDSISATADLNNARKAQ